MNSTYMTKTDNFDRTVLAIKSMIGGEERISSVKPRHVYAFLNNEISRQSIGSYFRRLKNSGMLKRESLSRPARYELIEKLWEGSDEKVLERARNGNGETRSYIVEEPILHFSL
jgi:predicted metalloprotease